MTTPPPSAVTLPPGITIPTIVTVKTPPPFITTAAPGITTTKKVSPRITYPTTVVTPPPVPTVVTELPPPTTTPPAVFECLHRVTSEDLESNKPVTFPDATKVQLLPRGVVKFTFPEPRDLSEVIVKVPADVELELVPVKEDGTKLPPVKVDVESEDTIKTALSEKNVKEVFIRKTDKTPLKPSDFTAIDIIACKAGKKQQAGRLYCCVNK